MGVVRPMRAQAGFQARLLSEVEAFRDDAARFRANWEADGPMAPGLDPMAAEERLKKFQQLFEVRGQPPGAAPDALHDLPRCLCASQGQVDDAESWLRCLMHLPNADGMELAWLT